MRRTRNSALPAAVPQETGEGWEATAATRRASGGTALWRGDVAGPSGGEAGAGAGFGEDADIDEFIHADAFGARPVHGHDATAVASGHGGVEEGFDFGVLAEDGDGLVFIPFGDAEPLVEGSSTAHLFCGLIESFSGGAGGRDVGGKAAGGLAAGGLTFGQFEVAELDVFAAPAEDTDD